MVPESVNRMMKRWRAVLSTLIQRSGQREALGVLCALAFVGSALLPLPIELAIVGLVQIVPRRWITFSSTLAVGSFIGGIATYLMGYLLMNIIIASAIGFRVLF